MHEIRFHGDTQRWNVYDGEKMLYPLHCGDAMLFQVEKDFLPSNLELDTEWYVKFGDAKFWLHRKAKYRVRLIF